jgi:hypothetical protein
MPHRIDEIRMPSRPHESQVSMAIGRGLRRWRQLLQYGVRLDGRNRRRLPRGLPRSAPRHQSGDCSDAHDDQ